MVTAETAHPVLRLTTDMLVGDLLTRAAENFPQRPAVIFQEQEINYQQYAARVGLLAGGLKGLGIKPGDFVVLLLPNHMEFNIAYLAIATCGAVVVPVNPLFKGPELRHIFSDCQARAVITVPPFIPLCQQLQADLPHLKHIIVMGLAEAVPGVVDYRMLMAGPVDLSRPPVGEQDVAALLYTSGTTGTPKGAMLTHDNLTFDAHAVTSFIGVDHTERYIAVLPLFHAFAGTVCILATACTGASVVIMDKFDPRAAVKAIRQHQVTIFPAVPTMFAAILAAARDLETADFASLKMFVSGGAALPQELYHTLEAKFGVAILEGNGPTETSPISYVNPYYGVRKIGSVGPPLPGVEVIIADENDQELPRGQVGEILVRGRNVMKGYLNQPEATAQVLRGGWFHTGDLGTMDEDGYVYIVDRKKDLILVGGFNVYPREVEEVLYRHPAVAEAAVIGLPDEMRGEVPVAFVVLKPAQEVTARQLIKFCQENLASYKCPRQVIFQEELPKMANGKIFKRAIKEQALAERQ
ncbi:MAG: long-chain-fatty-acid--CoA ligase [Desulfurispora sp.]|uniref:long-chain-fatty-acid--CoA ligase n=1 Tax=Desulfurispora sp. TaxID=3014275 RepID=UPI00404A17B4